MNNYLNIFSHSSGVNTIVLHHNDDDGFGSGYVAHQELPNARFLMVNYGEVSVRLRSGVELLVRDQIVDIDRHTNILILDFNLSEAEIALLSSVVNSVTLIDHHKTSLPLKKLEGRIHNFAAIIDTEKSAMRLVWEYFNPNYSGELPLLVAYVEDRDLWRFGLPKSREINALIGSYDKRFDVWESLEAKHIDDMIMEGEAILRDQLKNIRRIARSAFPVGQMAQVVNSPIYQSEVGSVLAAGSPVGVVFSIESDRTVRVSLRSSAENPGHVDVSEIAKTMGGGGHKHAAGFQLGSYADLHAWLFEDLIHLAADTYISPGA